MKFMLIAVVLCLVVASSMAGHLGLTPQEIVAIDASLALHGHSHVGSLSVKSGPGLAEEIGLNSLGHGGLSFGHSGYALGHGGYALGHGGYALGHGGYALGHGGLSLGHLGLSLGHGGLGLGGLSLGGPLLTKQVVSAPVLTKQVVSAPVLTHQFVGASVVTGSKSANRVPVLGAQILSPALTYAAPLRTVVTGPAYTLGIPTYKSTRPSPIAVKSLSLGVPTLSLGGYGGHGGLVGLKGLSGLGLGGLGW